MSGEADQKEEGGGGPGLPSVADMRRLVYKRKLIILTMTLLLGFGGLAMLSLITPQFRATATIFIDPRDRNLANMKQVTSDLIANTPSIESETEIIHSTVVAGRVIDTLHLDTDPELGKQPGLRTKLMAAVRKFAGVPEPVEAQSLTDLIEATAASKPDPGGLVDSFLQRVSAERVRETFLIQISYRSRDPAQAARVANALADAYVEDQIDTKTKAAEQATLRLDRQIAELRDKVTAAEQAVATFRGAHGLFDSEGYPLDQREVARQMEQLLLLRNTTAQARAKYEQARKIIESKADIATVGDVLKSNSITALKEQYVDALKQQAAAASRYGALHPNLIKAKAQAESVAVQLRDEVERIVANLKADAETATNAQALLEDNLAKLKDTLAGNSSDAVHLRELEREATAAREVYEVFLKRVQETQQQQSLQISEARIVNHANVPDVPISPKKMVFIAGGFGGGGIGGLMLAVLIELLFPSFVRTDSIEKAFKVKHITTIARYEDGPRGLTMARLRNSVLAPHSAYSESIRAVRVAIERQRTNRRPQIVLITSAVHGEGKSVIASNLALHYALSGVRTLLIDGDLSGRGLSRLLLPEAEHTLYDCIMTRLPVQGAIVREASTGMHFLPGIGQERGSVTPGEIAGAPVFARAIRGLTKEFEIIVLDGGALLPSVTARLYGELSDQIIYVHRWSETPQATARQALKSLGQGLAKVTGVILNAVDPNKLASGEPLVAAQPAARKARGKTRREPRLAA